jgi:chromosome segregation ATPase
MNMDVSRLSGKAREEYDRLQAAIGNLIIQDKNREPKLTDAEQAEIATLEARIERVTPQISSLQEQLRVRQERLKDLGQRAAFLVLDGSDLGELVDELIRLRPMVEILQDAFSLALRENSTCQNSIMRIKRAAREREV